MIMKQTNKEKYSELDKINIYRDIYSDASYALLPIKGKCPNIGGIIYCPPPTKQEEKQNEINK